MDPMASSNEISPYYRKQHVLGVVGYRDSAAQTAIAWLNPPSVPNKEEQIQNIGDRSEKMICLP